MYKLIVASGPDKGLVLELAQDGGPQILGRREAPLPLSDAKVSRHHARFFCREGQWYVEDLGSRNGTIINGTRIREAVPLRTGVRIQVGYTLLVFGRFADLDQPEARIPPSNGREMPYAEVDAELETTLETDSAPAREQPDRPASPRPARPAAPPLSVRPPRTDDRPAPAPDLGPAPLAPSETPAAVASSGAGVSGVGVPPAVAVARALEPWPPDAGPSCSVTEDLAGYLAAVLPPPPAAPPDVAVHPWPEAALDGAALNEAVMTALLPPPMEMPAEAGRPPLDLAPAQPDEDEAATLDESDFTRLSPAESLPARPAALDPHPWPDRPVDGHSLDVAVLTAVQQATAPEHGEPVPPVASVDGAGVAAAAGSGDIGSEGADFGGVDSGGVDSGGGIAEWEDDAFLAPLDVLEDDLPLGQAVVDLPAPAPAAPVATDAPARRADEAVQSAGPVEPALPASRAEAPAEADVSAQVPAPAGSAQPPAAGETAAGDLVAIDDGMGEAFDPNDTTVVAFESAPPAEQAPTTATATGGRVSPGEEQETEEPLAEDGSAAHASEEDPEPEEAAYLIDQEDEELVVPASDTSGFFKFGKEMEQEEILAVTASGDQPAGGSITEILRQEGSATARPRGSSLAFEELEDLSDQTQPRPRRRREDRRTLVNVAVVVIVTLIVIGVLGYQGYQHYRPDTPPPPARPARPAPIDPALLPPAEPLTPPGPHTEEVLGRIDSHLPPQPAEEPAATADTPALAP